MALVVSPPISAETAPARRASFASLSRLCDRRWFCWLCLSGYCGWLFFYGLTAGELYRTENLRAIIAAEFLRSGNWIVPTLYGEPLFTKPPGMYAAIALASWPFGGVQEWTARLPSAIAATLTTFLFYWYFGRQFGRRFGFVAGLILPISCLWLDKSTTAEIDMLQVFWISASILFFLRGLEIAEERESTGEIPRTKFHIPKARLEFGTLNLEFGSSLWFWWMAAMLCVAGGGVDEVDGGGFLLWHGRASVVVARPTAVINRASSFGLRRSRGRDLFGLGGGGYRYDQLA